MSGHGWNDVRLRLRAGWMVPVLAACVFGCTDSFETGQEVWARVNGEYIYREDAERYYRFGLLRSLQVRTMEEAAGFKLSVLNEMITNEILVQQAAKSGIEVSELNVDSRLAELRNPKEPEEFEQDLQQKGLTSADVRREVRRRLLIRELLERDVTSKIGVRENEIAEYYERNQDQFDVPETEYYLAQILVTPRSDPQVHNLKNDDAASYYTATQKIRALQARIRDGESFAKVAEEYSEDPSTSGAGGVLGYVRPSAFNLNPELRLLKSVITSLKVGEVSRVVQTRRGYYLVKLLAKQDPGRKDPSDPETRATIEKFVRNQKEQLLKTAYLEQLRNRAEVVNYLAEKIIDSGADWSVMN